MKDKLSRRTSLGLLSAGLPSLASCLLGQENVPKHILIRSSWQTVNIGDIAHTPGVLHILEQHVPEVKVTLWPSRIDNGVEEMLRARFPKLHIARRNSDELKAAFDDCDFLLHGSGPSLVAQKDVKLWSEETGKPYGVYGITVAPKQSTSTEAASDTALAETMRILSGARFVFFRDSHSLAFAKSKGCNSPVMEFGPDGAFACDLRDDEKAKQFLTDHQLEEGNFLCCIPRLRYTPYWRIKDRPLDPVKKARNDERKEQDHAPHREAILNVLDATDLKILLCPEDQTQMAVGKEMILDRLPKSALNRVVWRPNYWLTGEAVSTYRMSAGLFGNEMHSPIMCIGQGIPAIVCRWAEQTSKGFMWEDIGLGDWLFDFDKEEDRKRLPETVLDLATHPEVWRKKAADARAQVEKRQRETMQTLAGEIDARLL